MDTIQEVGQEVRERWIAANRLAGWAEPTDVVLPEELGSYVCECERCSFGPDESEHTPMLELVLRPLSSGDSCRLWHVLRLNNPEALTRLRQNLAAVGHPVTTLGDLKTACEALVGQRVLVELTGIETAYNGSDDLSVVGRAEVDAGAAARADLDEGWFGDFAPHDDIPVGECDGAVPSFGGSVRSVATV